MSVSAGVTLRWDVEIFRSQYLRPPVRTTVCPLSLGRRNEAVKRGVLGLLRSPKASLGPQGRAQITFRYRRHIYGLNGESR